MSTLKIEHIANIANSGPDISIDTSGHLNIVNGSLQMGGTTMLDTSDTTLKNVSKVGIGTASPQQLLHVNGGAADTTIQITNNVSGSAATDGFSLTVENPSGDVNIRNREATNMRFYTSNDEKMRLTSSGDFGLGTNNPVSMGGNFNSFNLNGIKGGGLSFSRGTNSATQQYNIYTTDDDGLHFYRGGFSNQVMSMSSSGNVGIGTGIPRRHFHINGGNESTKIQITNQTTGSGSDGEGFQLGIATNGTANLEQRENADMVFSTNNTERMRIDSSGRLGIATGADNPVNTNAHANADDLVIGNTSSRTGMTIVSATDSNGNIHFSDGTSTGNANIKGQVSYEHSDNSFRFYINSSTEALRLGTSGGTVFNNGQDINQNFIVKASGNASALLIDGNGGKVGINTSAPASQLDVKGDLRITRNVAAGHASEGNWNFSISMESASYYGSLYLVPSVSTGEFSIMGDKLRVTQSSGIQITSDSSNSTTQDNVAIRYNGTAGAHQSGYLFKDKRGQTNAAVKNNLQDDGAGSAAAFLEFYTSTGGTLAKAMRIGRYGEVAFDKMPNFATRPYYTNTELGAGAVVDFYNAHVNVGNHFNGSTNRFTAPYAGNYYFAFHSNIWKNAVGTLYFDWYKNGSSQVSTYGGRIYGYYAGGWENIMGFVVLPLAANDYVDLRAAGGAPKVDGGAYGQFIGYALTTP